MSSEEDREYAFCCPACGESLVVNDLMKDALIDRGCVICGATVTTAAFTQNPSGNAS